MNACGRSFDASCLKSPVYVYDRAGAQSLGVLKRLDSECFDPRIIRFDLCTVFFDSEFSIHGELVLTVIPI